MAKAKKDEIDLTNANSLYVQADQPSLMCPQCKRAGGPSIGFVHDGVISAFCTHCLADLFRKHIPEMVPWRDRRPE